MWSLDDSFWKRLPFLPVEGGDRGIIERAVVVLRGMAYEHRLHLLMLLRDGESTPGVLAAAIPADVTAVAHHLRFLRDAGLVRRTRRGRHVFYALTDEPTVDLVGQILKYADRTS